MSKPMWNSAALVSVLTLVPAGSSTQPDLPAREIPEHRQVSGGGYEGDMTLCQVWGLGQLGRLGDIVGLSMAMTAWNIGDQDLIKPEFTESLKESLVWWDWNGEYWRDELGFYLVDRPNRCKDARVGRKRK